jgi:putative aminopeptidase FrvX
MSEEITTKPKRKEINYSAEVFLEKYLNNASPTGFETAGQKIWAKYMKPFSDTIQLDNYGTCYALIKGSDESDNPYKVVIEAHADEISYFVSYITVNGLIYVRRNGGSDHQIAPSKRVHIHTRKNGVVDGHFGWPAIHLRAAKSESAPSLDNIFIDIGAETKEEVIGMGVDIGNVITYEDTYKVLNDRYYVGKSLDNKMGGFMIAEVARHLKENGVLLPFDLYVVNSVQEEIGLRGAQMITNTIKPDCAIITDVTHDTSTPMIEQQKHGDVKCGSGPTLTVGPAVHNKLLELIRETAEGKEIDVQIRPASGSTGTDTDAFAYSNGGVPSALIALPQRYMHTTVEMVHKDDVESVINLIYETLFNINNNHNFKYFDI